MSRSTRTSCCHHTPGYRPVTHAQQDFGPCPCACHIPSGYHPAYGPTPVERQPSKATGQLCPLVIRKGAHATATLTARPNRLGYFRKRRV